MQRINKKFLNIFLLTFALFISGCATQAIDPTKVAVLPGQGVLVTRVLTTNPAVALDLSVAILEIEAVQTGEIFTMASKTVPGDAEALYFGAFAPGRYRLKKLSSYIGNAVITAPLNATKEFDIVSGRLTDTGALVMQFSSVGFRNGTYSVAQIKNDKDSDVVIKMLPPSATVNLSNKQPLTPDITSDAIANRQAIVSAKKTASVTTQSTPIEGETVAFGRSLGTVSFWNPDTQKWLSLDTGSSFNVRSVNVTGDGSQLIGGEQGSLFANTDGEMRKVVSPGEGSVIFAGQSREGEYLALMRNTKGLVLYGSRSLSPASWYELKRISLKYPDSTKSTVQTGFANNRLFVIVGDIGWTASTTVHSVDLGSHTWTTYPADLTSLVVPTLSVVSDGTLITSAGTAFTRTLYRSIDFGKSWTSTPLENWVITVYVRDAQTMYAQRIDNIGLFSADNTVTTLVKSQDGGKSWTAMGELPKYMINLYILPRKGWMVVSNLVGDLYISSDDGKTWRFAPIR